MTAKETNPKDRIGSTKLPYHLVPSTATALAAMVHLSGAMKYGAFNWRAAGVRSTIYYDAMQRHLASWLNGETNDPESGLSHLGHVIACANILVDAEACGMLTDDRPPPAPVAELQSKLNCIVKEWKQANDDTEIIDDDDLIIRAGEAVCEGT